MKRFWQNDLISRSALREKLINLKPEGYTRSFAGQAMLSELAAAPAVNAVHIVRCGECWRRGKPNVCPMCQLGVYGAVPPYDKNVDLTEDAGFCHMGEKKDAKEDAHAKEQNKICPTNGAPCNKCVPGAHCAKTGTK